jgi:hypothetical protein
LQTHWIDHEEVPLQLEVGQTLKLVGSDPSLGSWRHQDAPSFSWTDDNIWQVAVNLPASQPTEFKIVQAAEAHGDSNWCVWQDGENTIIDPVALGLQPGQQIEVGCDWEGESRARMIPLPRAASASPAAQVDSKESPSKATEDPVLEAAPLSHADVEDKAGVSADAGAGRPWVIADSDEVAAGSRQAPVVYDPNSETWTFSVVDSAAPAHSHDWSAAEGEPDEGPSASAIPSAQAVPSSSTVLGADTLSKQAWSANHHGAGASFTHSWILHAC